MNSVRSMWKLFVGVAGLGLLVNNCTIKTDDSGSAGAGNASSGACSPIGAKKSGCICAGNLTSYQLCTEEGIFGACVCDDVSVGGASSVAGGTSYAGATSHAGTGGASSAGAAAVGDAGAGGDTNVVYATCEDCLADRCQKQFDACNADPTCISANVDGSGQYELIAACINKERVNGLVKRDVVRGCGVTIGASPDPDFSLWAPAGMDPVTTDLLNCMADAPGAQAASWANDDANYPVDSNDMINPTPWAAGTCAKDACTSAL